jgi:enoyl-CoA hydratase
MVSTRETVLRVAADVLADEGYPALTLERVASAVGVKPASLYHHFKSRDEMVTEVMTTGLDAVTAGVETALDTIPADQPLRRLEAAIRAHYRTVDEQRPFTIASQRTLDQLPPELRRTITPNQQALQRRWDQLFAGVDRAGIFPGHVDTAALRRLVTAALSALPGDVTADALADQLIELLRSTATGPGRAPTRLIRVEIDGHIGRIRLANPPVNSLTQEAVAGVDAAIEELTRSEARVVLVDSAVPGEFCGGADLALLRRLDPAGFETYLLELRATFERLANTPFPTIAVIDGPAMGCGLELAIACTFRVATPRSTFAIPEIAMGISPGAGSSRRLPPLIGQQAALDLVLSGRSIDATEAHYNGLIDRLDDNAQQTAHTWAAEMTKASRHTLAAALRSVRAHDNATGNTHADLREAVNLFGTDAATEGIEAHAATIAAQRGTPASRRKTSRRPS